MSIAGGDGYWTTQAVTIYQTITVTLTSVTGLSVGSIITISGNSAYNGTFQVTALDTVAKTVKITYQQQPYISGTGGTATIQAPLLVRSQNIVTASTAVAHGMNPGDMFTVSGVANNAIGGTISTAVRANNVITITTASANGVRTGSTVIIAGVTDTTFNGTWTVTGVISATAFQVTSSNLADASSSAGTVSDKWNNTQRFVISAPTTTSLTYAEVGPDDQTTSAGTITPVGQVNGGVRHAVCMFQTEDGYITAPSVPLAVSTSGNKKIFVSGIPLGPANIVARIVAFTGINGGSYFYIPVPARDNGNAISTSTVVGDNTSTSALFDFSDATLLSATAIDDFATTATGSPLGTNLFRMKTLGNCSGVDFYADRVLWWGDETKAINFLNMGFEGGQNADGSPAAWVVNGSGLTVVTAADFGNGIQFAAGSTAYLQQQCYLSHYGNAVLEANTQYTFKCWAKKSDTSSPSVVAQIIDTAGPTTLATVTIPITGTGFIQGNFSAKTPATMPSTAVLRISVTGNATAVVTLDELSCIYTAKPYNDTTFSVSYILSPESIDNITGIMGATADPAPIMDTGKLRDDFYWVTQTRLHRTKDLDSTGPSGWSINEVADKCGAATMQSMISGQSWLCWVAQDGARLFDGGQPIKITQEVQATWAKINPNALTAIWAVNDSDNRRIYWGVPLGTSTQTNKIFHMDYRFAETASEIEDRGAIRVSPYTGKMLVIELSRKFCQWNIPATAGGFLTTSTGKVPCFSDASGRTYFLDPLRLHDDDYGTIPAYYVTSPFVPGEIEQQLQLGQDRHLYTFMALFLYGTGKITVTPLADALDNPWPARGPYTMSQDPQRMMEIGLNVAANRCFFKFSATPIAPSLDAAFSISRMAVTMQPHPLSPVHG